MKRMHAHPARPSLASQIARGILYGLAAVGALVGVWAWAVVILSVKP